MSKHAEVKCPHCGCQKFNVLSDEQIIKAVKDLPENADGYDVALAVQSALVALNPEKECQWMADTAGNWMTSCDNLQVLLSGTPNENEYNFCPYCGGKITLLEPPPNRVDACEAEFKKRFPGNDLSCVAFDYFKAGFTSQQGGKANEIHRNDGVDQESSDNAINAPLSIGGFTAPLKTIFDEVEELRLALATAEEKIALLDARGAEIRTKIMKVHEITKGVQYLAVNTDTNACAVERLVGEILESTDLVSGKF